MAARGDFIKAHKYAPEDKVISKELRQLAEHDKTVYQKQKELYNGLFSQKPDPKPQPKNWLILFWQWLLSLFHRLFKRRGQKAD